MKKLFLLFLFFFPFSVFAGADTDRICENWSEYGRQIGPAISVEYPIRGIIVTDVWKEFNSEGSGGDILYYVVNVDSKKQGEYGGYTERAELYSYNCQTKKPKLLTKMPVNADCEYYNIDYINRGLNNRNIIMRRYQCGAGLGATTGVSVYNIQTKKKSFTLDSRFIFPESNISGFVNGKGSWYLLFESSDWQLEPEGSLLFQIDKKTKKITKL